MTRRERDRKISISNERRNTWDLRRGGAKDWRY